MRACGGCTKCCDGYLRWEAFDMGPKPCKFRTGSGCSNYENRPEVPCRIFACEWLKFPDLYPDGMRPDRVSAIFIRQRKEGLPTLVIVEAETGKPALTIDIKLEGRIGFQWDKETNKIRML